MWRLPVPSCSLVAMLLVSSTSAFAPILRPDVSVRSSATTSLDMISFGGTKQDKNDLPKDVKDAVSKCRNAVQKALESRLSRMDVEMPVGTKFGVEKGGSTKRKKALLAGEDGAEGAPTQDMLDTSDRELARLFVEMFQPLGGEHISVMFNEEDLADLARNKWKDGGAACRIKSLGRRTKNKKFGMGGGGKKKKKAKGFAAKMNEEIGDEPTESGPFQLPDNTEVALFVAPGPKELLVAERICSEVGMDTLVLLLNARLDKVSNFGSDKAEKLFLNEFEPVFQLKAAPQEAAPGCLLYRAFPNDWIMARKLKVGQPKPVMVQRERPSSDDCRNAYETIEVGDMEKNVENVIGNVASWFG